MIIKHVTISDDIDAIIDNNNVTIIRFVLLFSSNKLLWHKRSRYADMKLISATWFRAPTVTMAESEPRSERCRVFKITIDPLCTGEMRTEMLYWRSQTFRHRALIECLKSLIDNRPLPGWLRETQ